MQRSFKFTKLKLITGYILILLLGAIAIVFIYKQTIALTQKNFDTYMKLIEDIKDNMDTLKNLSISSEQNLRIDTINTLLGKRIENLKDL